MEKEYDDNGLYYDGHDIVNAFMWGVFVGALVAAFITAAIAPYFI
jgi:hypothetical protein